ncbi:1-acyl-sn-glycerol-3-phosphate acyltransferase [Patescibacteria group bacterium]|nr:1-acyl-sn-glycerol-3-phosphate acyltransferase [Patescibacteria group bacterium]MBU4116026.1 1-acyl-sn-glycerol-3-phosphate acyltransferase [Patescibacteria group bacterium]
MKKLYFIPPLLLQTLFWIPVRLILIFFIGLKVRGTGNLKGLERGVIFASNHANALDPILLPASLPFLSKFIPMFYTSRENTFYERKWMQIFFSLGLFFKAWGSYAVGIGIHNYEESLKDHINILNDKHSLFIFPEGRTTKDGNFQEAKGGVAFLAHKTNLPVVPIGINSTYKISWGSFFSRKRKVVLNIGKPIYPKKILGDKKEITINDYKFGANKIMDEIKELYKETS